MLYSSVYAVEICLKVHNYTYKLKANLPSKEQENT